MKKYLNKIINGDTLNVLKKMPSDFVDTIITSPPYWGLRDYGVAGQIGLEKTLDEFIEKLLEITKELKRVLKSTGVMFWNHGDAYGGSLQGYGASKPSESGFQKPCTMDERYSSKKPAGAKMTSKCLMLQNYRFILKMIDEQGWILRNEIIWAKQVWLQKKGKTTGSVMPTSTKDRFNVSEEPVFVLVKNQKYWWDLDAVRLPQQVLGISDNRAKKFVRSAELYPKSSYNSEEKIDGAGKYGKGSKFEQKYGEPWDRFGKNTKKFKSQKSLEDRMKDTKDKNAKHSRKYNMKKLLSEVRLGVKPNTGMVKYDISKRQKELVKGGAIASTQRTRGFFDEFGGQTHPSGKNLPTVWQIGTEPSSERFCPKCGFIKRSDLKEIIDEEGNSDFVCKFCNGKLIDHFAQFPTALVDPMIKVTCPKEICKKCGKARMRIIKVHSKRTEEELQKFIKQNKHKGYTVQERGYAGLKTLAKDGVADKEFLGWTDCKCGAGFESGIVLDPFMGSGTVAVVAKRLGRNYCGIELNKDYIKMAEARIARQQDPLF